LTFAIDEELRPVLAAEARAAATAVSDHEVRIELLALADAATAGLVDADLAKESARLQSLQTKQQLGVQALSIANGSSQILLGLFR